jgi:hypothetical protein
MRKLESIPRKQSELIARDWKKNNKTHSNRHSVHNFNPLKYATTVEEPTITQVEREVQVYECPTCQDRGCNACQ